MSNQHPAPARMPRWTAVAVTLGAVAAGFAAVYVTVGRSDNARPTPAPSVRVDPAPPKGTPAGPGSNTLSQGHMAAFVFRKDPEPVPDIKFQDGSGRALTLADWKGRVVLLNLWATWCVPCRKEMPALERLQRELGSDRFEVVAVSVDRTGVNGARRFLEETKVEKLALYADPSARMASTLRAAGLPATLLIDGDGREVGRLLGPAEWDSPEAVRLITSVMK